MEKKYPIVQPLHKNQSKQKKHKKALGVSIAKAKYNLPWRPTACIHAGLAMPSSLHNVKSKFKSNKRVGHRVAPPKFNMYHTKPRNPKGTMAKAQIQNV